MSEDFTIPQKGLLYFSAFWCQPCQRMKPIIEELKNEGYNIQKIDVEDETLTAQYFEITSIPTFVLILEGKERERIVGAVSKEKLERVLVKLKSEG